MVNHDLDEFGAYYTRINSGETFEQLARVKEHADLIVDTGTSDAALVFWRESSYLPFLETT